MFEDQYNDEMAAEIRRLEAQAKAKAKADAVAENAEEASLLETGAKQPPSQTGDGQ